MPDIYISQKPSRKPRKRKPYHEASSLAAYAFQPDNIHFETQQKDEEIVLFLRQHPIVNVPWIVLALLLIFAPLFLQVFLPPLTFPPFRFQLLALVFWYLLALAFIFERFVSWLFNIYIVTNERVVDIDFPTLVYKEVTDAELGRIQDVTFRQAGVVRAFFNYGDILVQTAGAVPNIEFLGVPRPGQVARTLQELREKKAKPA